MREKRKLYRSNKEKIFAGVAGGLGDYFDIDPTIVRLIFVVLAFINGIGILAYIVAMIAIPREHPHEVHKKDEDLGDKIKELAEEIKEDTEELVETAQNKKVPLSERRNVVAGSIIFVGILFLIKAVFPMYWFTWHVIWPVLLILLGVFILFGKSKHVKSKFHSE